MFFIVYVIYEGEKTGIEFITKLKSIIFSVLFIFFGLMASNVFAQNIDTTANATSTMGSFGVPDTATYGQIITIPTGSSNISKFGFKMLTVPSTVSFRGEIYAWDQANSRATGSALYESAVTQTNGATSQVVTFTPSGPIPVTAGQKYVLFVTTSRDQTGNAVSGTLAYNNSNPYSDGKFVYLNNGANPSRWTTQRWDDFDNVGAFDLGFIAEFNAPTPVPTLSQWALIVLGMLLAGVVVIKFPRSSFPSA